MPAFALRSHAFEDGKPIPRRRHTREGDSALDDLAPRAGARDVDEAMSGHVLAAAEPTRKFER